VLNDVFEVRLHKERFGSLHAPWPPLREIPPPYSQDLDDFGGDGGGEGYANEDESLVNCIRQGELSPQTCAKKRTHGSVKLQRTGIKTSQGTPYWLRRRYSSSELLWFAGQTG
jgi:hypothetical protein